MDVDRRQKMPRRIGVALLLFLLAGIAFALLGTRARHRDELMHADPDAILNDSHLAPIALAIGRKGFADHCAACPGSGSGNPRHGIPDLTDGDYLYGDGSVSQIETIILHGIRAGDSRGWDLATMPGFASARPYTREALPSLSPAEINDITQFLMAMHGRATDSQAAARGNVSFKGHGACWDCHGPDGGGDAAIGAPNLADDVWLYGDGSAASVARSIAYGHAGRSPAFAHIITAAQARAIAVYVASLSHHSPTGPPA